MHTWARQSSVIAVGVCFLALISTARADVLSETFELNASADPGFDIGGLSARAIFTLDTATPTIMQIVLFNTSTGAPAGFSNVDQLLTGISFDFGHPGYNGDPLIYDDPAIQEVVIGPGGRAINFDNVPSQLVIDAINRCRAPHTNITICGIAKLSIITGANHPLIAFSSRFKAMWKSTMPTVPSAQGGL